MSKNQDSFKRQLKQLPLQNVLKSIDTFLQESKHSFKTLMEEHWFHVDVKDFSDQMKIYALLPGYDKDNIHVFMIGNKLHIIAYLERQRYEENKAKRIISLPFEVNKEDIFCTYHNGMLTITITKHEVKRVDLEIY